jgi:hypothetical protein
MKAFLCLTVLLLSGCAGKSLDIRLCLSEDSPKRELGAAIRHRYYAEHLPPFRRVHLMPPGGLTRMCDVIANLKSVDSGNYSVQVVSAYSKKDLVTVSSTGTVNDAARSIGAQIFAAFDRGTPLHDQIVAERKGR